MSESDIRNVKSEMKYLQMKYLQIFKRYNTCYIIRFSKRKIKTFKVCVNKFKFNYISRGESEKGLCTSLLIYT